MYQPVQVRFACRSRQECTLPAPRFSPNANSAYNVTNSVNGINWFRQMLGHNAKTHSNRKTLHMNKQKLQLGRRDTVKTGVRK
jgi:hypothetical protein